MQEAKTQMRSHYGNTVVLNMNVWQKHTIAKCFKCRNIHNEDNKDLKQCTVPVTYKNRTMKITIL